MVPKKADSLLGALHSMNRQARLLWVAVAVLASMEAHRSMPRRDLLQVRRGTAAQWATANPTLASGEAGYETDTNRLKYGDGSTAWNTLDYFVFDGTPVTIANTTGLQAALDSKAASSHTHAVADTTGLQATLDSKASAASVATIQSELDSAAGTGDLVRESAIGGATPDLEIYPVIDYGASGSPVTTTGSINSSSPTLTVASASSFAIGQGVYIAGAGAAGANLITTISNIVGTTITLATNASTTVSNVLVQHDDTKAIQDAIDAAVTAGGGEVRFFNGRFRVNRAFDGSTNSILNTALIPDGDPPIALKLSSPTPPTWFNYDGDTGVTGTIIETARAGSGTWPSMFAGKAFAQDANYPNYNYISIHMENLVWRTFDNPTLSGLDLGMFYNAKTDNVQVDTGTSQTGAAEPTATTFGIRMPQVGNFGVSRLKDTSVIGYRRGVIASEHFKPDNLVISRCFTGLYCVFGYHPAIGNMVIFQCPETIVFSDALPVDFTVDQEGAIGLGWWDIDTGRDIYDPSNLARGVIRYKGVRTNVGSALVPSTTGCANLVIHDLHESTTTMMKTYAFSLWDGSTMRAVSVGANDSAGAGFRQLRVPNA
jgi:hypothetical protein